MADRTDRQIAYAIIQNILFNLPEELDNLTHAQAMFKLYVVRRLLEETRLQLRAEEEEG